MSPFFIGYTQKKNSYVFGRTLGPGAEILLGRLTYNPDVFVRDLTIEQLDQIAIKFDQWPLKPKVLFEDADPFLSK